MHEAKLYAHNAFVTLTYEEANLPARGQLVYADFQKFMRRLRKRNAPNRVRFYMCGEYGDEGRAHFHACLFNVDFPDMVHWGTSEQGEKIYRSEVLEELWPYGFSTIGEVNFKTAGYVARYCMKKKTGFNAKYYYHRSDEKGSYQLTPEFNKMSLKPGIGAGFYEKWKKDIYPHDYVVVNGKETKPPRYYDVMFRREDKETFEKIKLSRLEEGALNYLDNTERRLLVKEEVTEARIKSLRRTI